MYFFYIDESGTRDPETQTQKSDGSVVQKEHLYVLTAVSLYERKWRAFERAISNAKTDLCKRLRKDHGLKLTPVDCEVKSTWLRNVKQRESQSRFLSLLTDEERTALAETYYAQLDPCHMQIFSVVVDKRKLRQHMDHDKLHKKAYELLLERIQQYLQEYHQNHQAVIVMDDTDKTINRSLSMKHAWFQRDGRRQVQFSNIVELPFFTDSKLSNGVQLADLCGYNVYRAFRNKDFDYSYFQRLLPFFYSSSRTAADKLDGLKVWPDGSDLIAFGRDGCQAFKNKQPGCEAGL